MIRYMDEKMNSYTFWLQLLAGPRGGGVCREAGDEEEMEEDKEEIW